MSLTSVPQGQSLDHQGWIRQLTLCGVSLLCRAEVQVEGAVVWSEGATQRRAPARRPARRPALVLVSSREGEIGGVFGLRRGRGAVPLPHLRLSRVAPVGASPFSQRAHDGVGDVSRRGGVGGQRDRGTQVGLLGGGRALHSQSSARLLRAVPATLPLVSVAPSLLQDGFHVVPESTLRAVVTAGGEFGYLERRVGLPLTTPLDGLQFATNAVHGVVAPVWLGRAVVHPAGGGGAAGTASWSEKAKSRKTQKKISVYN